MCEKIQNKWFENTTEKLSTSFEVFESVFLGSRMAKMITSVSALVFITESLKKSFGLKVAVVEEHDKTEVSFYMD